MFDLSSGRCKLENAGELPLAREYVVSPRGDVRDAARWVKEMIDSAVTMQLPFVVETVHRTSRGPSGATGPEEVLRVVIGKRVEEH